MQKLKMEHKDHITLNLPSQAGITESSDTSTASALPRKSLKRTWNQLSRCQRNLIFLGTFILVFTSFVLLHDMETTMRLLKDYGTEEDASLGVGKYKKHAAKLDSDRDLQSAKSSMGTESNEMRKKENEGPSIVLKVPNHKPKDLKPLEVDISKSLKKLSENNDHRSINNVNHLENSGKISVAKQERIDINPNINIQELNLNDDNVAYPNVKKSEEEQPLNADTINAKIQEIIVNPNKMPSLSNNEQSIIEFVNNLENPTDARKQHFHGANNERQSAVVDAFKHSWAGYKKYAWGKDNLKPVSQVGHDWFGLGLTIVDSLDTMYIMGLDDEFQEATEWVRDNLNFAVNRDVNLFEVTIRVLGGLLSAYHLSGEKIFLQKSIELGNRLLPSFLSSSGIPYSDVNLADRSAHAPKWSPDSSTSEVTTIQLEFRDLSRSTNTLIYEKVAHNVNEKIHSLEKNKGLVPIFINANTGTFRNFATVSLGARGDSYYEYLIKQWIQTGRKDDDFLVLDYMRSIDGVLTELMRRTPREQHVFIGELINGKDFKPKMDHLTCYLPGTLLLGHHFGMPDTHLLLAKDLLNTCYQTYMRNPTGLAPEISYFAVTDNEEQDIYVKPNDAHNLLRPEFIESLYYFYALTGNRTYQDMGWKIFQSFETHTKVAAGYTSIGNVKNTFNTRLRDMMESFWLGETLKYFYLLFSDNPKEIDLEKWIFNTEAHLLPIRNH